VNRGVGGSVKSAGKHISLQGTGPKVDQLHTHRSVGRVLVQKNALVTTKTERICLQLEQVLNTEFFH
jgi:hypothetical protein